MIKGRKQLRRIHPVAVILGVLADLVITVAAGLGIVLLMFAQGSPIEEFMPRMHSLSGLLLSLIYGLGSTFCGSYVAGRIAKEGFLLHGLLVPAGSLLLTFLCWEKDLPFWYYLCQYGGMFPAGVLGGFLAGRKAMRRES